MLDALQRTVTGVITSISPQADPQSRVFSIEVTIDNSREDVRPGMIGSITLGRLRAIPSPRLVVPLSAVVRVARRSQRIRGFPLNRARWQIVRFGAANRDRPDIGNSIEVTRGLTAGQKIISLGGAQVRDGQQVNILP